VQPITGAIADRFGSSWVLVVLAGVTVLPLALFPFAEGFLALAALAIVQGTRRDIIPVNNTYVLKALPDHVQSGAWGFL